MAVEAGCMRFNVVLTKNQTIGFNRCGISRVLWCVTKGIYSGDVEVKFQRLDVPKHRVVEAILFVLCSPLFLFEYFFMESASDYSERTKNHQAYGHGYDGK